MKTLLYILFSIFIIISSSSCEDYKDCNSPVETALGIGFYHVENFRDVDSTLPSLSFHPINAFDTTFQFNIQGLYAPLNPHSNVTKFYIRPDSSLTQGDTITLQYTIDLKFVSSGCGFTNYYTLDSISTTTHHIDSITIKENKINVTKKTNVKIYY